MRRIIWFFGPVAGLFLPFGVRSSNPEAIRAWVREAVLERVSHDEVGLWHTGVYVRRGEEHDPSGKRVIAAEPITELLGIETNIPSPSY